MRADELFRIQHDKVAVSVGVGRGLYYTAVGLVVLRLLDVILCPAFNNELAGDLAHDNGPLGGCEQIEDISDRDSNFTTLIACVDVEC